MKTSALARLLLLPLACAAMLTAPLPLNAQKAATPAPAPAEKKIDLNIPEGRLSLAIKLLREKFPDWNFTCEPEIAHLKVSDIQLRSADANSAALAVCRAMERVAVEQPESHGPTDRTFSFYYNLHLLEPQKNKNVETGVEAFSLKDVDVDPASPDENAAVRKERLISSRVDRMQQILKMVSSTIDSIRQQGEIPVGAEPRFQTYPEANVLIAIGSRDGIEITRKIVNALNDNQPDPDAARRGENRARALKPAASPAPAASPSPAPTR